MSEYCPLCGGRFMDYANGYFFALGWAQRAFPKLPDDIRDGQVGHRVDLVYRAERHIIREDFRPPTPGHVCRVTQMIVAESKYACWTVWNDVKDNLPTPVESLSGGAAYLQPSPNWVSPPRPGVRRTRGDESLEDGFSRVEVTTSAQLVLAFTSNLEVEGAKTSRERAFLERKFAIATASLQFACDDDDAFAMVVDGHKVHGEVDGLSILIWRAMLTIEPERWARYADLTYRLPTQQDVAHRGGRAVDYADTHARKRILRQARDSVLRALEDAL